MSEVALNKADFLVDEAINVAVPRAGVRRFAYQDGDEAQLLAKISRCSDRSVYSSELLPYGSWSQEYHLSPLRGNILAPLDGILKPGTRVLEIGAGCGAITRALGERGCIVDAIEGSIDRAKIAAARCKDLGNVRVYCSDFGRVDFGAGGYDVVTLIGVLEYAALFFDTPAPFDTALSLASRHLSESGTLFVAIENQLGLKYFNGMREDHVGIPFYGIQGMYQNVRKTAETFTKKSLSKLITRAGLAHLRFFYPYPDYKLPTAVLVEGAFSDTRLAASQIVSRCRSKDYSAPHTPLFHEASVLATLADGGIAEHFANSFAVVASRAPIAPAAWTAKTFSNRRRPEFCMQTTIRYAGKDLEVEKNALCPGRPVHGPSPAIADFTAPQVERFHEGSLLSFELAHALYLPAKESWPRLRRLLLDWVRFLKTNAGDAHRLDGSYYDAIPANMVRTREGLQLFDVEWRVKQGVPLLLPVVRGLVSTFGSVEEDVWLAKLPQGSVCDLCILVLGEEGIVPTEQAIKDCIEQDADIQEQIYPTARAAQYRAAVENLFFRDLRRARWRKSAKAFAVVARHLARDTPVMGPLLSRILAAARK